jgi:hypothetical protein
MKSKFEGCAACRVSPPCMMMTIHMEAQLCIACDIAQASKNDQGVALCNLFQFISLLVVSYSAEAHVLSH